jgi:hypothetical protein
MNRCMMLHRLTGPAILLLLGIVALLHEAHIVSWNIFVPLLLILIGVIKLAERAAMASEPYPPYQGPYQGAVNPNAPQSGATFYQAQQQPPAQTYPSQTSIVPTSHDFDRNPNGGNS